MKALLLVGAWAASVSLAYGLGWACHAALARARDRERVRRWLARTERPRPTGEPDLPHYLRN